MYSIYHLIFTLWWKISNNAKKATKRYKNYSYLRNWTFSILCKVLRTISVEKQCAFALFFMLFLAWEPKTRKESAVERTDSARRKLKIHQMCVWCSWINSATPMAFRLARFTALIRLAIQTYTNSLKHTHAQTQTT